jgi:hypothetical protein
MGITMRAAARSPAPTRPARRRYTAPANGSPAQTAMGRLFKVLGVHAPAWPQPEGF